MSNRLVGNIAAVMFALTLPGIASAFVIYDDPPGFGAFPNADFGGTGIPNNAVAASRQIIDGDTTITIAIAATQRFSNPALGNDGDGRYFAGAGSNFGGNNESASEGALWNFSFYIGLESTDPLAKLTDYQIDLFYDFDPAGPEACCSVAGLGKWNITNTILSGFWGAGSDTLVQDSQNLMFGFLAVDQPGGIDAPAGPFDPDALGNYQFAISVTDGFFPIESVAIEVNVVPVPAAVWLFGSALGILGWMRRRRTV